MSSSVQQAAGRTAASRPGACVGDPIRAPRGVGWALAAFVALVVAAAVYLIAVRREALFVDLAGLSGMLFCF